MLISKDEFILTLNEVEAVFAYHKGLNNFFSKNDVEGFIFQPDCSSSTLRLLHSLAGNADKDNWISYFVFDLDFGKKWKPGMITEKDGTDIVLKSSEDLYEYLKKIE